MLSERLLELENEGLLTKKVYGSVPPKVEYRLTASARELVLILTEVCTWHARWMLKTGIYEILNQPAR
jgi:DNA-binding HxlR family transcriptional regulator